MAEKKEKATKEAIEELKEREVSAESQPEAEVKQSEEETLEGKTDAQPEAEVKETISMRRITRLQYIGKNSSYTIGNVRFEPGEEREVHADHAAAALDTGFFEEA